MAGAAWQRRKSDDDDDNKEKEGEWEVATGREDGGGDDGVRFSGVV